MHNRWNVSPSADVALRIRIDSQWQAKRAVDIDGFSHPSIQHHWSFTTKKKIKLVDFLPPSFEQLWSI